MTAPEKSRISISNQFTIALCECEDCQRCHKGGRSGFLLDRESKRLIYLLAVDNVPDAVKALNNLKEDGFRITEEDLAQVADSARMVGLCPEKSRPCGVAGGMSWSAKMRDCTISGQARFLSEQDKEENQILRNEVQQAFEPFQPKGIPMPGEITGLDWLFEIALSVFRYHNAWFLRERGFDEVLSQWVAKVNDKHRKTPSRKKCPT